MCKMTKGWYGMTDILKINVGPQHPSTHGVLRLITELDGENLEFRYCSKCKGNFEYCQEHLFTHEHKK